MGDTVDFMSFKTLKMTAFCCRLCDQQLLKYALTLELRGVEFKRNAAYEFHPFHYSLVVSSFCR